MRAALRLLQQQQQQQLRVVYKLSPKGRWEPSSQGWQQQRWPRHQLGDDALSTAGKGSQGDQRQQQQVEESIYETQATTPVIPSLQARVPASSLSSSIAQLASSSSSSSAPPAPASSKQKAEEEIIQGILIPHKPEPPKEDECCMSGCAHCVYDLYADDVQQWLEELEQAVKRLRLVSPPSADHLALRFGLHPPSSSPYTGVPPGQPPGGSSVEAAKRELDKVVSGLDPGMQAFLAMERRIKEKQKARGKSMESQ